MKQKEESGMTPKFPVWAANWTLMLFSKTGEDGKAGMLIGEALGWNQKFH